MVDSHTGGEPTRIIVGGGPKLPFDTMALKLEEFRLRYDYLRHGLVNEPRGSEVVVGALLCFGLRLMAIRSGWQLPVAGRPEQRNAPESAPKDQEDGD